MALQLAVNPVGLPMWLPGRCDKGSHILLWGQASLDVADEPQEQIWVTCYGPVLGLKMPRSIFKIAVKLEVPHLEALVTATGTSALIETAAVNVAGVSPNVAKVYLRWVAAHSALLGVLRSTDEPLSATAPDT